MSVRFGIIMLGPTGSGKSVTLNAAKDFFSNRDYTTDKYNILKNFVTINARSMTLT